MSKRVLITGGTGFIGHHLVEHFLLNTDWEFVCLDRLDTSGTLYRLHEVLHGDTGIKYPEWIKRVSFVYHDLKSEFNSFVANKIGKVDYILHLAAGSHVDRSIEDPMSFVMDNVVGTTNLLNFARTLDGLELFVNFSTDEVFGPAPEGVKYKEWDRYNSTNPYSASKAGAEEMCLAFANTYKLPLIQTHCMNVFGERQHPEKFIPLCIQKVLSGDKITIHASPEGDPGRRHYIHARNTSAAVLFLLQGKWEQREKYNIVGEKEVDNLQLAQLIAQFVGKPLNYELVDFHSSRPGHDLRYALDGEKMQSVGWKLPVDFEGSLQSVVEWTLKNDRWLNA
jgi:dTDP-glucose 4,6-dehydratase